MYKYKSTPKIIEAARWNGIKLDPDNLYPITFFKKYNQDWRYRGTDLVIHTLEGEILCRAGDYIVQGVNGEFYPVKPEIFKKCYEKIENDE